MTFMTFMTIQDVIDTKGVRVCVDVGRGMK